MDENMLLPVAVREEAFMMEANLPDVVISMQESGNFPGMNEEQLTQRAIRDINSTLRESQCYLSVFSNRRKAAFFWLTPAIAQRYLSLRDALTQSYSHSSPLRIGGQVELIPQYNEKVHAYWCRVEDIEARFANRSLKQAFALDIESRLDLHWYPVPMDDSIALDAVYHSLRQDELFVNVEPFEVAEAVVPFPPNAKVTADERQIRHQQYLLYMNQQMVLSTSSTVRNPPHSVMGGIMEVTMTAGGLLCNRLDYPKAKTPILTWKQIRKVIPKAQRRQQRQPGQPLAVKRRRVVIQRKEE